MSPRHLFVAVMAISILNGMFSPIFVQLALFAVLQIFGPLIPTVPVAVFVASLFAASTTLVVSGVPAALYERFLGDGRPSATSHLIWLGGAVFLSLPALAVAAEQFLTPSR